MANANGETKANNRPKANKFTQQKLDSWQPILTPHWVIGTFVFVALIFIPVGATLIWSHNYFEIAVEYDGPDAPEECIISSINEGYINLTRNNLKPCILNFTFDRDVDSGEDLYIYYELSDFYQNHRRYVQSRSDPQLRNDIGFASFSSIENTLSTSCQPDGSLVKFPNQANDDLNFLFYPCGLIARSYFNEGIQLYSLERDGATILQWKNGVFLGPEDAGKISIDTRNIAWKTDLDQMFRNPVNQTNSQGQYVGNAFQYQTFEYLWQTYDQASCYNRSNPAVRLNCLNWTEVAKQQLGDKFDTQVGRDIPGDGCAACDDEDAVLVYEGGIPPPENYEDTNSAEGVRNQNFIEWMRIAALPTFRKLYGNIKVEDISGIKEGDVLSLRIIPNFLVSSFGGTKKIIIGTTSPLGTQNRVLGIAYFSVGIVCVVLAVLFFLKLKINPRKLGDPKYLHWKQN